jgi:hypothetical protein
MRIAAVVFVAVLAAYFASPAAASPSAEDLFRAFALFGSWAVDCQQPATPDNPHVGITLPSPGLVLEEYDLGADYERNRNSVLSAQRLSPTQLAVSVIFQPGAPNEERQKLVFAIRNGTRRTLFNQPEGGAVRVKDGIALAFHVKTPLLRKCE